MIGTHRGDQVLRHAETPFCGELLQAGLPVEAGAVVRNIGEHLVEQIMDDPRSNRQPMFDEDRTQQGLDGVGKNAGFVATAGDLLATAEAQVRSQT